MQENLTPELKQELEMYHLALDNYFDQHWDTAETMMMQLHEQHPHCKIYRLYVERIKEIKAKPLPPDWDGVYVHTSK